MVPRAPVAPKAPIRFTVVFEADDEESLVAAVDSFLEDFRDARKLPSGPCVSTRGWRYKTEIIR